MAESFNSYSNFFHNRTIKERGYPDGVKPIDFQYNVRLYGRVDSNQNAVMLTNKEIPKSNLEEGNVFTIKQLDSMSAVFALNFVAEAFKDMQKHFRKATAFKRLATGGLKKMVELEPKAGWVDPQVEYDKHLEIIYKAFTDNFLFGSNRYKKVLNFDGYMAQFKIFHDSFGHEIPLTKTGFLKSNLATPLLSGLMIEIDKLDPNDSENASKWISDLNFNFYKNTAIKYGFLVDKYMPWRLVADVSSKQMQERWERTIFPTSDQIAAGKAAGKEDEEIMQLHAETEKRFGLVYDPGDASNLFEQCYEKTYLTDAEELKEVFYNWYNNFITESPVVSEIVNASCRAKKLTKSFKRRDRLTRPVFNNTYNMNYWIEMCLRARIKEENIVLQQSDYERILKNAGLILKKLDKNSAMNYINNVIKISKAQADTRLCQNYQSCV
tara:strand:- start:2146 stop:3459 length:1314 start_codon:yes stop_codon:yes gene_type:complete